jgi:hypothetical protein
MPTAGAGITTTAVASNGRYDFDSVLVQGFYINANIDAGGGAWSMRNSVMVDAVLYGVKIQNTLNNDSGDWSMSDCSFWQLNRGADAAIRTESSGGGKITNCKFNGGSSPNQFKDCIRVQPQASSVLLISNCSFENYGGASGGIGIVSFLDLTTIVNCEFAPININSYAVFLGSASDAVLSNLNIRGTGQTIAAVVLDTMSNVEVGPMVVAGFTGRVQVSGTYSGALIPGESTSGALSVSSNTVTPYFTVSQTVCFIPDSAFTWDNTGNIGGGGSYTAVVGKPLYFTWSPSAALWFPSY